MQTGRADGLDVKPDTFKNWEQLKKNFRNCLITIQQWRAKLITQW